MKCLWSSLPYVAIFSILLLVVGLSVVMVGENANSAFCTVGRSIGSAGGGTSGAGRDYAPATGAAFAVLPRTDADATATRERPIEEPMEKKGSGRPKSGTLTAAGFDDTASFASLAKFLKTLDGNPGVVNLPRRFTSEPLTVLVVDKDGAPVGNARVSLAPGKGGRAIELISRTDGRAIFVNSWDQVPDADEYIISVTAGGAPTSLTKTIARGATPCAIQLPGAGPGLPANLDLVLLLDTTGSMGDELEYLKSELKQIVATIHERFPTVKKRYALICYRDIGDEYVTRTFPFTESLAELQKNLAAQKADGGGDIPEAVQEGLEQALQLTWRTDHTARVMFHLADAPAHPEDMERCLRAVDRLRKKGVAIYPVACSGYDPPWEFLMRTSALLTGGEFLFLTDDSGVGNAHAEPHIPFYQVQKLDRLMVRMITSELLAKKVLPDPKEIIRTVGQPPNVAAK
jgi:hypothetical protein